MDWQGKVLSINANCSADQEKPPRPLLDETLASTVLQHGVGLACIQEYRFKAGSSFQKFNTLRDLLPGMWRRWKVSQLEFEAGGMVPLILWDDSLFDCTTIKLAGPGAGTPMPSPRGRGAGAEEPFAGRYTAVLVTPKTGPGKESGAKLLLVAYHGQSLVSKDNPVELSEGAKLANASAFLELVGAAAVSKGVPAIICGDWATSFGVESQPLPAGEDWFAQLRPVAVYSPSELDCYRYRNSKAPVDFLAVVNPVDRAFTVEVAGVSAVAHPPELQAFFDHDPLLASFAVSPGEEAVIPPAPLLEGEAGPLKRRPGLKKKLSALLPVPADPALQLGALDAKHDQLEQSLAWLRREAEGSGSNSGEGEADGPAADKLDRAGVVAVAARAGGAGGKQEEWESLASQLVEELALVKDAASQLLEQKNGIILSLQAKLREQAETLRLLADEASDASALAAADPLPAAFSSTTPGRDGAALKGTPITPEPSRYGSGWRSPTASTNGF